MSARSVHGEVAALALPYAIARMDCEIAWADFETALEHHELEAATEAIFVWFDKLRQLESVS